MSTAAPSGQQDPWRSEAPGSGWYGYIAFAGILMVVLGIFHAIIGLVGLFKEDYFLVGDNGLMVSVDYSLWGWVHLIFGLVVAGAGLALVNGATWARIVAVVTAVLSSIINIAFMSAYPIWSVIMITIDILVIYAVTVHGDQTSLDGY